MKKITQQAANAFVGGYRFTSSNTRVINDGVEVKMFLFGNLIARRPTECKTAITITAAEYKSNTTKERLNGLPGVYINQHKGRWYLNGIEWDGSLIAVNGNSRRNSRYAGEYTKSISL